ncbi:MAG: 7TM diverse intracellular signaling domain-containing protein [Syntrophales bacterium]|nr:7TM diverse intracellular signaling domain-containing protein [Syntrophales bacterium]
MLAAEHLRKWGIALFFVGSLLVMGLYHLVLYWFRRTNRAPLYFGLYCLLWLGNFLASLFDPEMIRSVYLIQVGMFIFILFQAFALSRRFSRAFASVERLSAELEDNNVALSRMDRLKDEFLANTSHELRTPLSSR